MIKVAIDSGPVKSGDAFRGIGVHTANLVRYLRKIKRLDIEVVDFSKTDLSRYDIVHYQKFHPYFFSFPLTKKGREVLTIHDLIYLVYPKHYPAGIKGKLRFWLQKLLVKRMEAVITISETSKKDIVRFLGIPAEKINVIYLAPRKIFRKMEMNNPLRGGKWKMEITKRYGLPERFVLYVGDVNYNKNVKGLIKAFARLKHSSPKNQDLRLVLVGKAFEDKTLPEVLSIHRWIGNAGVGEDVRILGFVPDEDLVAIYNLASVYCQPSFYEGFGLPLLEAMASGCPVVASEIAAHVEIAKAAALFANPFDPKDFAEKINRVLRNNVLRNQLIETGKVLVKNYSWDKTARETARVYRSIQKDPD